ncbi:hypothetical protein CAPTEDRAFT_194551 [Capitella teleta]|uniref:Ig-like domain-containing protein n=1 Tax=Capitella teleta TaxID=283909 RepID=R7ULV3_CAPTE|nr:hypothetical protein CAPTEDRAFT_194551 [Capitella teleta]|eukprot:ELU04262.1 hypothetical protein CAPTEDRAFT_194551 [Capitella teleta]
MIKSGWIWMLSWLTLTRAASGDDEAKGVVITQGKGVVLPCQLESGPVMWFRPGGHSPVAIGHNVINSERSKIEVTGDYTKFESNLGIGSPQFPVDDGVWTCSNTAGAVTEWTVSILVPPASPNPTITPKNTSVVNLTNEVWTFTCSAHFAQPEVELKWVKVTGNDAHYDVTPMQRPLTLRLGAEKPKLTSAILRHDPSLKRAVVDRLLVVMLCGFGISLFALLLFLTKTKRCWKLDVRLRINERVHRSNSLAKPVFNRNIDINDIVERETNAITSVVAGSALWLDCSKMVYPMSSVVQVTWRKNTQAFYRQYIVDNQIIGLPDNSTLGHTLKPRISSQRVGQIAIWPLLPEESDAYTCEVNRLLDNEGKTKVMRHSTTVVVTLGPLTNWVLIGLLGVALLSALIIILIGFYHTLKWSLPRKTTSGPPSPEVQRRISYEVIDEDTLPKNYQCSCREDLSSAQSGIETPLQSAEYLVFNSTLTF